MKRDSGVVQEGGGKGELVQKPEKGTAISTYPAEHQNEEGLVHVQWGWQIFRDQEQTGWMV